MTEPPKRKKIKIDENLTLKDELKNTPILEPFPRKSIEEIHQHLGGKCLCGLKLPIIKNVLIRCNRSLSKHSSKHEEVLLYISILSLFFEISMKQHSRGYHCTAIAELVSAGADIESGVVNGLLTMLASEDKFISYSAGRAMTSLLLVLNNSESYTILKKLAMNLIQSKNPLEISHSLNIVQNIIDWKDMDDHPLELNEEEIPVTCKRMNISAGETNTSNDLKVSVTKSLEPLWPQLVQSLVNLICDYSPEKEHVLVSYFSLWESIISVKANLSISNLKVFYYGLEKLLDLLKSHTSSIIWRKVIDLYNEFLCYGSTLALQDALDESCNIANLLIATIKSKCILEDMPWQEKSTINVLKHDQSTALLKAGSSCANNSLVKDLSEEIYNKILLQKLVLLILKAVALLVKESRYESSSDDSSCSSSSDSEVIGTAMNDTNIYETLTEVDLFVKTKIQFNPGITISEWIVKLFTDQDDWLIESMLCCLDIYNGSLQASRESSQFGRLLSPHRTFSMFSDAVHYDHDVFLDFLVSNETCFLLYFLRYLKFLKKNWRSFLDQDERTRSKVMAVFIRLRLAIERLVSKKLFPYDITPILRLLDQCEELYESYG